MIKKKKKRDKMVLLRLNKTEYEIFRNKARLYSNLSSMIRDAVAQFDDVTTKGKIDAIDAISKEFENISKEFSKEGNNLNQLAKRANELMYAGELSKEYYEDVVLYQVEKLQNMMIAYRKKQAEIIQKITIL